MKAGVRISYLSLALVAFLTSIVLQAVAAVLVMTVAGMNAGIQASLQGITDEIVRNQMAKEMATNVMPVTIVVTHLLLLVTYCVWYMRGCHLQQKISLKDIKWKEILVLKNIFVIVFVAGGMCFFTNFAMPIASMMIPKEVMTEYQTLMENAGFGESLLPTIAAVLIAPFGEEFIFRGVTFYYAKQAVSDVADRRAAFWIANCIQALGFGIFHMNPVQGTYAFIIGLALGYLVQRFGTVLPAMLGHMLINSLSSFAWAPVAKLLPENYVVYGICAVGSLVIVFVGLYLGGTAERKVA